MTNLIYNTKNAVETDKCKCNGFLRFYFDY